MARRDIAGEEDDSLFVRVQGYRVVLQDLEAVAQIVQNMEEALAVLKQVDDVKQQSIQTFLDNIDRLEDKLSSVQSEMPAVDGMEQGSVDISRSEPQTDEEVVDESINDLHSELKGLKEQLDDI